MCQALGAQRLMPPRYLITGRGRCCLGRTAQEPCGRVTQLVRTCAGTDVKSVWYSSLGLALEGREVVLFPFHSWENWGSEQHTSNVKADA